MGENPLYAEVILPLAAEGTFTYFVPEPLRETARAGYRVLVEFGKKKRYSAVVHHLTDQLPGGFRPKKILSLLDDRPVVSSIQLRLWEWMASYYMCSLGEVMKAALPSALKLESETRVRISKDFEGVGELSYHELLLYEVIKDNQSLSIHEISSVEMEENALKVLNGLMEKGAVESGEEIRDTYRPRTESFIILNAAFRDDTMLSGALDELSGAPKQLEILERILQRHEELDFPEITVPVIPKKNLMGEGFSSSALTALVKKGILEVIEKEVSSPISKEAGQSLTSEVELTLEQGRVLSEIRDLFKKLQTVLLKGVTSSGKTEIYIRLIRETIDQGRQVLYLLPEIALTTQMVQRLKAVFGNKIAVYHSKFSDTDRMHIYRNLAGLTESEPFPVILGARSSLFLPFRNLGLIIVDEEHENSYKQYDPAPRYHARDASNILALYHRAKVLLGTATPSFETYFNAKRNKFGYTELTGRFGDIEMPEIIIADIRQARKRKQMVSHFTPELMQSMEEAMNDHEQVMLFQNRRGYTNYVVCEECGHIPRCSRCDVSLTYHKSSGKLECHYCGRTESPHKACEKCHHTNLSMVGFGTEKIEDELGMLFKGKKVGRLDTDSARTRKSFEKIVNDFASGKIDILVGTQLISKGFDFENVSLVGVLDADAMLNFPDFRSFERSFQLMSQVSGRAGRRMKRGKVIIQTSDPSHPVIEYVRSEDYEGLFMEQMEERKLFGYPPYIRLIRLMFKHRVPSILDGGTDLVSGELKEVFGSRILGPQYPPVRKIQDLYQKQMFIKIEREASYEKARQIIGEKLRKLEDNPVYRGIRVNVDVDPL